MKIKPTVHKPLKADYDIPEGFVLVKDTREQDGLYQKPPKGLLIVRDTLNAGDYSIKGFESVIAIERKELSDFYGSIGKDRSRFKRELEKLKGYQWAGLVIESDEANVLSAGSWYTQMSPQAIRMTLVSIELRYRINIYYGSTRNDCERWILDRLLMFYKYKREGEL